MSGFLDADESREFSLIEHKNGEHESPKVGCPICEAMRILAAEGGDFEFVTLEDAALFARQALRPSTKGEDE